MKHLLYLAALLALQSCHSHKSLNMKIPKINSKLEKYKDQVFSESDTVLMQKIHNKKEPEKIYAEHIKKRGSSTIYKVRDENGNLLVEHFKITNEKHKGRIHVKDFRQNPIVGTLKVFHPNGTLRYKGVITKYRFKIGKHYRYDENGNIEKVIDYDQGFEFDHLDIFAFCKERGISLEENVADYDVQISKGRNIKKNIYTWSVAYKDREKIKRTKWLIDGKTGKIKKTIDLPFGIPR